MAPWESLPEGILYLILDKILNPIEHVWFAAVCKDWGRVSKEYNRVTQRWLSNKILPMLLIPSSESYEKGKLYSVSEKKVYNIELPLPCSTSKRFCGSIFGGWLTTIDLTEDDSSRLPRYWDCARSHLDVSLVNPFRKEVAPIPLPRLKYRPESSPNSFGDVLLLPKVILSGDPIINPDSFVVLAINRNPYDPYAWAFTRGLNSDWVYEVNKTCTQLDGIIHKGHIYLVDDYRCITRLDVDQKTAECVFLLLQATGCGDALEMRGEKLYLVESTKGDLLLVQRFMEHISQEIYSTQSFTIHKVVFMEGDEVLPWYPYRYRYQLVNVDSIGDEVLFVGDNYSFSGLAADISGCQPNSVYYTDDFMGDRGFNDFPGMRFDMGVFNIVDKSITRHCSSLSRRMKNPVQPPFWTIPPFNGLQ